MGEVADAIPLVRVPCRFGGTRPYFICPGSLNEIACGRRVSKLYAAGRHFRCRHCHQLAYASQDEERWERRLRRANKTRERVILERLGGAPGLAALCPPKPTTPRRSETGPTRPPRPGRPRRGARPGAQQGHRHEIR
jgi:hypothetical protein